MAGRGNKIIVSSDPKGHFEMGVLAGAYKPGMLLEIDETYNGNTGIDGNGNRRFTVYAPGTDGMDQSWGVLLENELLGSLMTVAYASGDMAQIYFPVNGEELNVLKGDVSGTGDDFAIMDRLMADTGSGKVIKTTGSPQNNCFQCLETITDPTADVLVWVRYIG